MEMELSPHRRRSRPNSFPVAAAIWDVNHNQILDVVIVDGKSDQAAYLLGNGQGGFGSPQMTSFPAQVSIGVLADVDEDGNLDLVTNNTLYPGDGKGGFLAGIPFQSNDGQNAGAPFPSLSPWATLPGMEC